MRHILTLVGALLAGTIPASAHDFWIAPSTFRPGVGEPMSIELRVGEHLTGESVARNPEKIERFFALALSSSEASEVALPGMDGRTPAGYWRASHPGLAWIGYQSLPSSIELPAVKFEAYLVQEGLESISELRKQSGDSLQPVRERFSRCAKALVWTEGADPAQGFERTVGFPLELAVDQSPYALRAGDELSAQLLFEGRPLASALVGCTNSADSQNEMRLRTDAEGRVRFRLQRSGVFLLRVVHMVPAPEGSGADWESYWASLTFELAEAREPMTEGS